MSVTRDGMSAGPPDRNARLWDRGGRRRRGGGGERAMVPPAEFTSYYGRPVVKAPNWTWDIPAYLFTGGLAAGSSLLAAGADLTGRPALRRAGRLSSFGALLASTYFLIHDLGRPSRFYNMLRVVKPTSPMSVGTWILATYGPMAGAAAAGEMVGLLPAGARRRRLVRALGWLSRPTGLVAGATGPALASYTAVLLADTAVPTWHEAYHELPLVFAGSAAAAGGGLAMMTVPTTQAGPARRQAVLGAALELGASMQMERRMRLVGEPLHEGRPGQLLRVAKALTVGGAAVGGLLGRRSRLASVLGGGALVGGSVCTRFGIFYAGVASARDPKYTVVPQRERLAGGAPGGAGPTDQT